MVIPREIALQSEILRAAKDHFTQDTLLGEKEVLMYHGTDMMPDSVENRERGLEKEREEVIKVLERGTVTNPLIGGRVHLETPA